MQQLANMSMEHRKLWIRRRRIKCALILEKLTKLLRRIITLYLLLIKCQKGQLRKLIFCFLDGYSGFSQIAVKKQDQEKTTFTCPYGTFAYRRMPFGLCNTPSTFQRCMPAIFHGFCEEIVEVFMDDFSIYGTSFDNCLHNLDKVLHR